MPLDMPLSTAGEVARQAHHPCLRHWRAALEIVQRLKSAREKGIVHEKCPSSKLAVFTNLSSVEK